MTGDKLGVVHSRVEEAHLSRFYELEVRTICNMFNM